MPGKQLTAEETNALSQLYITAGIDTSYLSDEARDIERTDLFKQIFYKFVETKVGEIPTWPRTLLNTFGTLGVNSFDDPTSIAQLRNITDEEALVIMNEFLKARGVNDKMQVADMRSTCRVTPTGWIRNRTFRVYLIDNAGYASTWTLEPVLRQYEYDVGEQYPESLRHQIDGIYIELILVNAFDVPGTFGA